MWAQNLCRWHLPSPVNHFKTLFKPKRLSWGSVAFSCQKENLGTHTHVLIIERSTLYTFHFARGCTGWEFLLQLPTIQDEVQDWLSSSQNDDNLCNSKSCLHAQVLKKKVQIPKKFDSQVFFPGLYELVLRPYCWVIAKKQVKHTHPSDCSQLSILLSAGGLHVIFCLQLRFTTKFIFF